MKMTSSTGHLAISHTVSAVEPMPSVLPMRSATEPVTHDDHQPGTRHTTVNTVTASRTGAVFQIGRPSGSP